MAPAYKAPGPISIASNYLGSGSGGGGGGGGGTVFIQDRTGDYQNRLAQTGLEGWIQGDLQNQRFAQQSQLAQQHAELNAWQYQQQVTEQEAAQQRQDQNSIAAIDADQTMTPLEKMQAKLRIKTRIDWVGERQKRDLQAAQVEQAQAHATMYKQIAELDNSKQEFWKLKQAGKVTYEPTPEAAIKIGEELRDAGYGDLEKADPNAWAEEVRKRALASGQYQVMIPDPKSGIPTLAKKEFQPGGGMPAGSSASSSTGRGGTELDASHVLTSFHDAMKTVAAMAKEKKDDGTPVHPEYQTEEGRIAGATKIANASRDFVSGHFQAKNKSISRTDMQAIRDSSDAQTAAVLNDPGLDPTAKQAAVGMLNDAKRLFIKYKGEDNMPDDVHQRYMQLKHHFDVITGATKKKPAAAAAAAGQAAAPEDVGPFGTIRRAFTGERTTDQGLAAAGQLQNRATIAPLVLQKAIAGDITTEQALALLGLQ